MRLPQTLAAAGLALVALGCLATTQQEVQMGREYAQQINAQLPIVDDPEINRYLTRLGDSIARVADSRNLDWRFFIVDARDVNAFAVPGGFIYVNRGLIERMTTMSQLAAVVGHEIGHVTERHSVEQMAKQQRANMGITLACVLTRACGGQGANAAIGLGANALFARFSRADEAEADRVGLDFVVRAGIDPTGMPETFRILMAERARRPEGVETWFITHPLEEDRIRQAEAIINAMPPARVQGLTRDSRAFQDFKRRLQALPPSPPPRG
ncbi:MAG: M48 family metallopeptidase [Gemmatimonadaceae bacterium]|jgi:predicted Zn-dependent protease|nr:M48 family metallopeptidase [Gemmatimonadaceae bacterium]